MGAFLFGGERGIRTLDRVAPMPPFQGGDLNRSSISPKEGAIIAHNEGDAKYFMALCHTISAGSKTRRRIIRKQCYQISYKS